MSVLDIAGLEVRYGGIRALHGITLHVERGEIVTLLGANGAGKTTTLRAISGLIRPSAGDIRFEGESLLALAPHKIAQRGIAHVPEGRRVFTGMSVRENLELGAYAQPKASALSERLAGVLETFPRLRERFDKPAGTLSGGEQQMLAIGRALMSAPRLLLLDEPSLGLAPIVVQTIFSVMKALHAGGVTMLLVEQNARAALALAQRGYVLENGAVRLADAAANLAENPAVVAAYLGGA